MVSRLDSLGLALPVGQTGGTVPSRVPAGTRSNYERAVQVVVYPAHVLLYNILYILYITQNKKQLLVQALKVVSNLDSLALALPGGDLNPQPHTLIPKP